MNEINNIGLDVSNLRGQGYDNGSNMKGKHQGVQKRILGVNPRSFYSSCDCHSLNLVLYDMTNSCPKTRSFLEDYNACILYFLFQQKDGKF